eukprot:14530972-Alexandrium_andersonii.AAC.1
MPQEAMKTRVGLINVLYVRYVVDMLACCTSSARGLTHTHALLEHEQCIGNATRPRFQNTPGRPAHTDGRTRWPSG